VQKICVLVCAVVAAIAPAQGQGRRFIAEKDVLRFTSIADPQISPAGSMAAFVRVSVNGKTTSTRNQTIRSRRPSAKAVVRHR
jgi:hypothetical protein